MNLIKRTLTYIIMLALLAFPLVIFLNAQALTDWWQLRNYTPPANIVNLATQDMMSAPARHIFYVNHPDLESDPSAFKSDCRVTEQTIVLGCYHGNQNGIFIYNVTDSRLAGVQQVTAAHEMLHAAYDRLSKSEKNNVNSMLENYYQNNLHDQRLIETINSYKQSEPNDVVNEMHSVFGTEATDLPTTLENYYARYFTNRHAITDFAANYQGEFTSREDKIKADAAQLDQLKAQIDSDESQLQALGAQIDTDRARLNGLRNAGRNSEYNAGVSSFNREVDSYNVLVQKIRNEISTYNQLVEEYNSVAKDLASLEKSLDSRQPQTTQ
jgi:uncharacterized protein YukE